MPTSDVMPGESYGCVGLLNHWLVVVHEKKCPYLTFRRLGEVLATEGAALYACRARSRTEYKGNHIRLVP